MPVITHPFATTARPDATPDRIAALLSERVVYRSPLVARPLVGRDLLVVVLATAGEILDLRYVDEFRGTGETLLRWEGSVTGRHRLEGIDVVRDDPATGRVLTLGALLRPLPIAVLFRDEMRRRLGDRAPPDVWETTDETPLTAFAG